MDIDDDDIQVFKTDTIPLFVLMEKTVLIVGYFVVHMFVVWSLEGLLMVMMSVVGIGLLLLQLVLCLWYWCKYCSCYSRNIVIILIVQLIYCDGFAVMFPPIYQCSADFRR